MASGIDTSRNNWNYAIFNGNLQNIFLNALWGYGINSSAPAAVAPTWSDYSRKGKTTAVAKHRGGSGGQALSPP